MLINHPLLRNNSFFSPKGNYKFKLLDFRWKRKRKRILERDNYTCVNCGKTKCKLIVHHKQYHFIKRLNRFREPWDYEDKYLVTLCENCHKIGHETYKIPIKHI